MKCREDFVTNSSSSSFIFVFRDESDYSEFYDYCELNGYMEVYNLINSIKSNIVDFKEAKNKAIEIAYNFYSYDIKKRLLKEMIPNYSSLSYSEQAKMELELTSSEMFKDKLMDETFKCTECGKVLDKLDSSEIAFDGMIWDTNGGLLEWAIRNDLLNQEFGTWCVLNYNIG